MYRKIFVVTTIGMVLSCCGSKTYYKHSDHGRVDGDNVFYKSDWKECGNKVYGSGIEVDGATYKERQPAVDYIIKGIMRGRWRSNENKNPPFWDKYMGYEKATHECMNERGWSKLKQ